MCIFTWILLSLRPQTDPVAEGFRLIFSMFAPFLSVAVLFVLLDSWFGRTVYEGCGEWLHTEKILFGYRRDAFDYDLDLLTECHISPVDGGTPVNREELERLRHAGATIRRRGRTGPEYPRHPAGSVARHCQHGDRTLPSPNRSGRHHAKSPAERSRKEEQKQDSLPVLPDFSKPLGPGFSLPEDFFPRHQAFRQPVLFLPCPFLPDHSGFRSPIYHDQVWLHVYFIPCRGSPERDGREAHLTVASRRAAW